MTLTISCKATMPTSSPEVTSRSRVALVAPGPVVLALVLCVARPVPVAAAGGTWTPAGPTGGGVYALVAEPSQARTLYAGAYAGGVWQSTDAGVTWRALDGVPRQQSVHALALQPGSPRVVLAGTYGAGIWRSADGGATWQRTFDAAPYDQAAIQALAFDPATVTTVYAGTDSDGHPNGVLRSTDGGATWQPAGEGMPKDPRVWALAVDPRQPAMLYAGTGEGVFRSSDGAATWQATGSELADETVRSLAVAGDGTIVAGVQSEGLWWSSDGGASWRQAEVDVDLSGDIVFSVVADAKRLGSFHAGVPNHVLRSIDGGKTFASLKRGLGWLNFRALALDPSQPDALLAGTNRDGVTAVSDGGKTWQARSGGFHALDATAVAGAAAGTLYVGSTQAGVHRSRDGGQTWELANEGLTDRSVLALAIDPRAAGTLLAGTESGIFRSTDGATSWTHVLQNRAIAPEIQEIAWSSSDPSRVYAREDDAVYRSDDGGATWKTLPGFENGSSLRGLFGLAVDPAAPDIVLANAHRTLFRSTDGGQSWSAVGGIPETSRIQSLVADPASRALWAGTTMGVYRSGDGGASWSVAGRGAEQTNVQALLVDRAATGTIYAATWSAGVLRTTDGGKTWSAAGGKPPHPDAVALAIDPGQPGSLLVAFGGGGVWRLGK